MAARASAGDVAIAVSVAVASAIGADMAFSSMSHQNMYLTRIHDLSKYGWYTPDPKTRNYMLDLQEMGEDPRNYLHQNSNQLDKWRVRQQYLRFKASGYRQDF